MTTFYGGAPWNPFGGAGYSTGLPGFGSGQGGLPAVPNISIGGGRPGVPASGGGPPGYMGGTVPGPMTSASRDPYGGAVSPPRMGFGDLSDLDWLMVGAGAVGTGLQWWEARAQRKSLESQHKQQLRQRQLEAEAANRARMAELKQRTAEWQDERDYRNQRATDYATAFGSAVRGMYG